MHRQIFQLAWPMIFSNLTIPLLGLVDTAILGHLPTPVYLGAVAIGAIIFDMLFWTFAFLRMGTTGLTAQAWGAKDFNQVRQILFQSLILAFIIGLLLIAAQSPLFKLAFLYMAPEPEVEHYARIYCEIRILSAPATLCNYVIYGWLLSLGKARTVMLLAVATNLVNIFFDYWLVMRVGMLTDGVAWGSVIADIFLLISGALAVKHSLATLTGRADRQALFKLSSYLQLMKVNRAIFLRTIFLLFSFSFFYAQSAQQDNVTLAANSVLITLLLVFAYGQDGFANAAEVLIGRSIGASKETDFYQITKASTLWFGVTSVLFSLAVFIFDAGIINLLTDIEEVVARALIFWPWLVALPLIACWSFMFDGIFIGATKTDAMQNTMAFSSFIVFIPVWYFTLPLGNHGLWLAFCCFHGARSASMALVYYYYSRKHLWFKHG